MDRIIAGFIAVVLSVLLVRADGINIPFSFAATTCSASQWLNAIAASTGAGTCAQPAFTNLSGSISNTQLGTAATAWTPADGSGASLTFTGVSANYVKMGNMVFAYGSLQYPSQANGSSAIISGLPVATANANYAQQCSISYSNSTTVLRMAPGPNATTIALYTSAGAAVTNLQMSNAFLNFMCIYPVA